MLKRAVRRWKQYRYRFVPWIALNLKDRTVREVPQGKTDKIVPDKEVERTLIDFFSNLDEESESENTYLQDSRPINPAQQKLQNVQSTKANSCKFNRVVTGLAPRETCQNPEFLYQKSLTVMKRTFGFVTKKESSSIAGGGIGVYVKEGIVPTRCVVSMYPGTIYHPFEPLFFQSIGNPFIFRCIDNILIDGNDRWISSFLYKSCQQRDRIGPYMTADSSWLTNYPINPLAVGQYVNNQSRKFSANVAYQEFDIPSNFPFRLRKYLPNVNYGALLENEDTTRMAERLTRVIMLISLRPIEQGEELFSTYFTVVH